MPKEDIPGAIDQFRVYYHDAGWLENEPYPGVREMLDTLQKNGFRLFVATSKLENAQWVMTNTDLQTADQLPPGAYNAFTFSSFSQWTVQNVFFIEFPKRPAVYVVQVNMDNSDAIYQLFLTPGGRMLQTKDASYNNTAISPSVFDFM